ncbi:MAG: Asp23/Gls24 family envelope stress response protein [Clostridiales bacterium]|jgi:uncharacterized alkaline shock family protein YloU|nr:Asp23/Gls24 family envelope stress response protein [Clostridiales bacterium]
MSVFTTNAYGRITVTTDAIAQVAGFAALECYGVVDLVAKRLSDNLYELFHHHPAKRGVKVVTNGDKIFVDLYVILKYGVSIDAVCDSLKRSVKYRIERFTGMLVGTIDVNVVGVRV